MPIPGNNVDLYCDKCQFMINTWWSVAINRAHNTAYSLRVNALVAQQGLFFLLFTLAVKSELHPEMLQSLITGSRFLVGKEKDHIDRDHLGIEILWNSVVFNSKYDSGSFLNCLSLHHAWAQGIVRTSQGIHSTAVLTCLYKPPLLYPSEPLLPKLENSPRNLIILKETCSQSSFGPGQTVWSQGWGEQCENHRFKSL